MKISVIISAYNEEKVIRGSLFKIAGYFQKEGWDFEIIVSDDGSKDKTVLNAEKVAKEIPQVRLLKNIHKGKGHGIYQGVMASKGDVLLLCDADLATPIEEFDKLWVEFDKGNDIVIASREGLNARRMDEPFYRHLMGRVFNLLVQIIALRGINDTQCGFKLLRRESALNIFSRMKLYGEDAPELSVPAVTAYDVEMLYLAHKLGYRVVEVPTQWQYQPTVRISPLRDSWRNLKDVFRVRLNDWQGLYD